MRPGNPAPRKLRRAPGFSLLEIQVSVLLASFVFAGLSLLMLNTSDQMRWLENTSTSSGTTSPVGLVMTQPEVTLANQNISGKFTILVQSVAEDGGTAVITVQKRAAVAGDCGR